MFTLKLNKMSKTIWNLDTAHSEVMFRVRHLMVSTVSGKFNSFNSTVSTDDDQFNNASITFSIDTASIDTGMEARDNHLRSDDFFAADKFSIITFKSTKLVRESGDNFKLEGNLSIRDVTKPIVLDVEFGGIARDPYGNIKAGFEVNGKIKRKEFGLTWDALTEAGGAVVADEIKIHINVQYAKVQAETA